MYFIHLQNISNPTRPKFEFVVAINMVLSFLISHEHAYNFRK